MTLEVDVIKDGVLQAADLDQGIPTVAGAGATGDGHSHIPVMLVVNDEAMPDVTDLAGEYEWVVTATDAEAQGWTMTVDFTVTEF